MLRTKKLSYSFSFHFIRSFSWSSWLVVSAYMSCMQSMAEKTLKFISDFVANTDRKLNGNS